MTLNAHEFIEDPRVQKAKSLIQEALSDHQKKVTYPKPADPDLVQNYESYLKQHAEFRGGDLWFPYLGSGFGNGSLVELADGSIKYDMICGIGPHYWGHSHPDMVNASLNAALSDTVMQGHLQQNIDSMELCESMLKISGMDHCFLSTTGVMANENALKIALQKKSPAGRILAFERCFMGRTIAASQITDKPAFRQGLPASMHVSYIPFFDASNPEESTKTSVQRLKKYLQRYPGEYAIMCFELIQGEGGFYPGERQFFVKLMEVLKEHNVAIMVDEVQSFGRTPDLLAFKHFGLEEYIDIVTIGKLSQVCATLFKKEFRAKPGLLSQTFTGSTASIRASQLILDALMNEGYKGDNGKIAHIHQEFTKRFEDIQKRHPGLITGPFGVGTMIAFTPFEGAPEQTVHFVKKLYDNGVITFVAGTHPMRVRMLAPAGAITDDDIQSVCQIVESTLLECAEEHQLSLSKSR